MSDASVTTRMPASGGEETPSPTALTVPSRTPPESVSGLCILPRAATISRMRAAIAYGSPPAASRIWRCDVESRQSRSTSTSVSNRRQGPDGSSLAAGCGSDPGGSITLSAPSCCAISTVETSPGGGLNLLSRLAALTKPVPS